MRSCKLILLGIILSRPSFGFCDITDDFLLDFVAEQPLNSVVIIEDTGFSQVCDRHNNTFFFHFPAQNL